MRLLYLFLFIGALCHGKDYDAIVVGSSPFSLLEALYQDFEGKSVLVLEAGAECGGAWQSIEVCGIEQADLGCHLIGTAPKLIQFFKEKLGCRMVPMDDPLEIGQSTAGSSNGYYFSGGCHELVSKILGKLEQTGVELRCHAPVDQITFDLEQQWAVVQSGEEIHRARKIHCTHNSSFQVEKTPISARPTQYRHLYLLIADSSPPTFSYKASGIKQVSRMMNMTHFVGLTGTGLHLVAFQVHENPDSIDRSALLENLIQMGYFSPRASILRSEGHLYETRGSSLQTVQKLPAEKRAYFEILSSSTIAAMNGYIERWAKAL